MKDRHRTLDGKAKTCLPCMMKPLGPPNYYKLQGSLSSLHESNSAVKVFFSTKQWADRSLLTTFFNAQELAPKLANSFLVRPELWTSRGWTVRALWLQVLHWESNDSSELQRRPSPFHILLDSKVFVAVADVFWSQLGGRRFPALERTLCSWHVGVNSHYLGHSPRIWLKGCCNQGEMRFLCTGIGPSISISQGWVAEQAMATVCVCLTQGHLHWGSGSTLTVKWHQKKGWGRRNALWK